MAKGGFPGMGGANMQQLMKQAQKVQKMQQDIQRLQEELSAREFTATVGGGAVTATVLGSKELKKLEIAPSCVDPDDIEMLQDLVICAVNEAMRAADETSAAEMNKVTGGIDLGF